MPLPQGRMVIYMGSIAGAIVSIAAVLALARPYMASDDPPLAGRASVEQLSKQFSQWNQQDQMRWTQQQSQSQFLMRQVLQNDYRFWSSQLNLAQQTLAHHPYDPAASALRDNATQQLRQISQQLGLIPPR